VSFLSGKRAGYVALTYHGKTHYAKGHGGPEATQLGAEPFTSTKSALEVTTPQPVQELVPVPFQTEVRRNIIQKDLN
jgi:hypothetical protein